MYKRCHSFPSNTGRLLLWFLPFIFLPFLSCQEEELDEEGLRLLIQDTWFSESPLETTPPQIYRNETTYRQDGTYSYVLMVLDESHNLLGYASQYIGNYRIEADNLIILDTDYYGLDDENPYLNLEDLQLQYSSDAEDKVGIAFNKDRTKLTLDYGIRPCLDVLGVSSMCIDVRYVTWERVR